MMACLQLNKQRQKLAEEYNSKVTKVDNTSKDTLILSNDEYLSDNEVNEELAWQQELDERFDNQRNASDIEYTDTDEVVLNDFELFDGAQTLVINGDMVNKYGREFIRSTYEDIKLNHFVTSSTEIEFLFDIANEASDIRFLRYVPSNYIIDNSEIPKHKYANLTEVAHLLGI